MDCDTTPLLESNIPNENGDSATASMPGSTHSMRCKPLGNVEPAARVSDLASHPCAKRTLSDHPVLRGFLQNYNTRADIRRGLQASYGAISLTLNSA